MPLGVQVQEKAHTESGIGKPEKYLEEKRGCEGGLAEERSTAGQSARSPREQGRNREQLARG